MSSRHLVIIERMLAVALLLIVLGPQSAGASESNPPTRESSTGQDRIDAIIAEYCLNIADRAADARIAWQTEKLNMLFSDVEAKIRLLEDRRIEVQAWVEKQQQLMSAAEAGLVEIYAKMDPDAAASQLATLDTSLSSSVLRQLKPREASAILNEMKPDEAAPLIRILAAATQSTGDRSNP